jgi:hypothetical protein
MFFRIASNLRKKIIFVSTRGAKPRVGAAAEHAVPSDSDGGAHPKGKRIKNPKGIVLLYHC